MCVDSDEEDGEQALLHDLHEFFLPVVRSVIHEKGLFQSVINQKKSPISIRRYGKAQIRRDAHSYAGYLHNDVWRKANDPSDPTFVALVNVWLVLNDEPPSNSLVFCQTTASLCHQSHMLHGSMENFTFEQQTTTMSKQQSLPPPIIHYDPRMAWGRFYVFVSGQVQGDCDTDRVLLHGAMDHLPSRIPREIRQSLEMRYQVHQQDLGE